VPVTQFEFEQVNDAEFASQTELDQVKDNNRDPSLFVASTMNNYDLWLRENNLERRANDSNFSFFNPSANKGYIEIGTISYTTVATFIYRGTNLWIPTVIYAVLSRSKVDDLAYLRLFDFTNSRQIIEFTWSAMDQQAYTITGLTNLPATLSAFEVQLRNNTANAGSARLHAMGLYPS